MVKPAELREGCMSRALDEEMTFVLLARDVAAPGTIRAWCDERIRLGRNKLGDHQIIEARICANEMERQYWAIRAKLAESSPKEKASDVSECNNPLFPGDPSTCQFDPCACSEEETPCPVCGGEERNSHGLLRCECPSPSTLETRRRIATEMIRSANDPESGQPAPERKEKS